MSTGRILILSVCILVWAGSLYADEFEDYVYGLDDISGMNPEKTETVLDRLKDLDPDSSKTFRLINRIFGLDISGLDHVMQELSSKDYYTRSSAARRILTYTLKDIKNILAREELQSETAEKIFQIGRIRHEFSSNYYHYRKKIIHVRNNLLFYLASCSDPRFFDFARRLYTEGSFRDKQSVLTLAGYFKGKEKTEFFAGVFAETEGALVYRLFNGIRDELDTPALRSIAGDIVRDPELPALLRASTAASIRRADFSVELPEDIDPFIQIILETDEPFDSEACSRRASAEQRTFPKDTIFSTEGIQCRGWITRVDLINGVICDTGANMRTIPLFKANEIKMVPTGRRRNMDYVCRVIFTDGDSVSGNPVSMGTEGMILENSYLRNRADIEPDTVAAVQFNTENQHVPSVHVNSLQSPVARFKNGDSLSGQIIRKAGKPFCIRLSGFTVRTKPGDTPSETLFIDTDAIRKVDFPVRQVGKASGFCGVITMYGDRLSGNLIKMGEQYLHLYSRLLGNIRISRDAILSITLNSGFSMFKENAVLTFPLQDTVSIYNIKGKKIWEKKGLKDPVYAERLPNGDICICERENGTVAVYSEDYVLKREYKGFDHVSAVRALPGGNLLISCERFSNAVVEISPEGSPVSRYVGLTYVVDAVKKPDGTVVAVSRRRSKIALLRKGRTEALKKRYIEAPVSIQLLQNGNVLAAGTSLIAEYRTDTLTKIKKTEITKFSHPRALLHEKNIYCVDENALYKLDRSGNIIRKTPLPQKPESIFMY